MPGVSVSAADGEAVSMTEASAATSGVLTRQPTRGTDEPPVTLPFSATALRVWGAGRLEGVSSFEAALEALKVADFLEAPMMRWARRAYELAFAPTCPPATRAAADALLATQTDHIRGIVDGLKLALDGDKALHEALQAPEELHALAMEARLCRGGGAAPIGGGEIWRVLQGLRGALAGGDPATPLFAELHRSEDNGLGLPITASHAAHRGRRHALTAAELPAAARALQGVAACQWLSIDGGHAHQWQCKVEARRASSGDEENSPEDADMSGDSGGDGDGGEVGSGADDDDAGHGLPGEVQSSPDERVSSDENGGGSDDGGGSDEDGAAADEDGVGDNVPDELMDADGHGSPDDEASAGDSGSNEGSADGGAASFGDASSWEAYSAELEAYVPLELPSACQALVDAAAAALTSVLSARDAPLRLRSLALEALPLRGAQTDALAVALATQTQLRRLALRRCHVSPACATRLLDAAGQLPALESLELQHFLDNDPTEAAALVARLPQFTALTFLQLEGESGSFLHSVPPVAIAAALTALPALRHLALPQTAIYRSGTCVRTVLAATRGMPQLESFIAEDELFCLGPRTGEAWAALAANAATLTRLSLAQISAVEDAAPGIRCLAGLTGLRHLDFMGNDESIEMEIDGARALAAALAAMPRLTHLNIGKHSACAACARALVPAIGRLTALQELGLEWTFFEEFSALAAALAEHCAGLSALRVIKAPPELLTRAPLNSAGDAALAPWLQRLPGVEVFSVAQGADQRGAASAAALCSALRGAKHLDLSHHGIRVEDRREGIAMRTRAACANKPAPPLRAFGAALDRMSSLRALYLNDNGLVCAAVESLGRIGARMGELRHLNVAFNSLRGPGLIAVGEWAVACTRMERLNVSDQRDEKQRVRERRIVTAAELDALAHVLAPRAASGELLVVAHGCRAVSEAESAAVRTACAGAVRWEISNGGHWSGEM